jgi:hypothetical protein
MLTTLAMAGGRSSAAADWSNTLDANATAGYVTNPRWQPGVNTSDEFAQVMVDGSTSAQTEHGQLTVTPRLSVTRYVHETDLDIDAGSLELMYLGKLERGQWMFDVAGLTDSTVTSELGTTGVTNVNRRHTQGNLSLSYQYYSTERLSWLLQGSGQITRYNDAAAFGLTDYDYGSVAFGPTWNFSERVQGSLTLEADRLSPHTGARQNDYSASLQLKRNFSERYAWRVSVGGTRVEYANEGSTTSSQYELGASRQGERVQWDVSIKRAVLPIGLGLLTPETVAALGMTLGTSEHSTLNITANAIRTQPVFVTQPVVLFVGPYLLYGLVQRVLYSGATWGQVGAEWRYQFTPHWSLSAAYRYGRSRVYPSEDWANGSEAHLGIVWNSGRL